jgi:phage minor structural protein, N-terminal domain protein
VIYLFDKEEKLIKVVRKNAIKSALQKYTLTTDNYVSDRLTVEMKALNDDEFEQVEFMAIQSMENTHLFHYFYIAQKATKGEISTFTGVQSGIEELRKTPVFDKRPKNTPAKPVINELLQGTNWQARFIADTTNHSTNFYYTSVFDALKKICKVWGLEMQFFVEMNSNGLGARYIDFKKKIGEAVGKRVVYGHNALEILKEVERTNIFTALIGRGKGEQVSSAEESGKGGDGYGRKITFEDVVWSKAKGDPLDKPKGQKYLEIPEMTRVYGIKNSNGSMRPKIGFTDFNEEENPNELIKLTYQTLINLARPQLALKTSSVYLRGVKIGDTIRVVRHDKKLDYDTRIFEITFNRLNNQSSDIKLGDQIGESSSSKAQAVADKAVEEFINNEFNSFIENLPDFIRTADGFNTNWYSVEDPTKKYPKKVMINDIWYKPDPEHEGHKIMYRWTGEVWEEILRTYNEVSLRGAIDQKFNELKQAMDQQSAKTEQQINDALSKSGLGKLANDAKKIAEQTKGELEKVKQQNQTAKNELTTFKQKVQEDLDGKPSLKKVTDLIDGVKEQFTTNVGLRNYMLETGLPANSAKGSKIYKFSKDTYNWETNKKIRVSFDYSADQTVRKFQVARITRFKNGITHWDSLIDIDGKDYIDTTVDKNGKYSHILSWPSYKGKNASEIESMDCYLTISDGSGNVKLEKLMLSVGTNETDWVPAFEDQTNEIKEITQTQAEFEKTAQGLKTKLDSISTNFNPDGTTSEKFNRFLETKTAEGISRERVEFGKNYVAKNTYNEKISEIEQKFNRTDGQLTQFATYKNGLDGQYATITKQLSDNQTAYSDFKHTSDTLVQTFGTTGDQIANNISRMLLNNQMFQVEIGKYSTTGGPNMIRNSRADDGFKYWEGQNLERWDHEFYFNGQKHMFMLKQVSWMRSPRFLLKKNTDYILNFFGFNSGNTKNLKISIRKRKKGQTNDYTAVETLFNKSTKPILDTTKAVKKSIKFNTGDFDEGYLYIENAGPDNGADKWSGVFLTEFDLYEGVSDRLWQPAPEDATLEVDKTVEATRTQVTQLNDSYSIRNLNNAGDVLGQLNLNPDGSIKINEGLLSIGEKTYIKDGVIKKSMIGNAQIDTAHIREIDASQANIFNLNVNNINGLNAEFIKAKIEYALVEWLRGKRISAMNGKTIFNLNDGRLSFHDNNTGIYREEPGASSQGMFFRNDDIRVDGYHRINSKVIIGADRRDNDIFRNWSQGGFNGMIVDTVRGIGTEGHDNADKVTFVGDRFKFTHSYEYDRETNSPPYGWNITTWGAPKILPFGTNLRNTSVQAGDFGFLNDNGNAIFIRQVLRTLKTALQHFVNAGFVTDDFIPQNGKSMRIALHSSIRNAVTNSLRDFDKLGI